MKTQTKVNIIIGVVIAIIFGWLSLKSYRDKRKLYENGVYVIGSKFKYESRGNRGGVSYFEYSLISKKYQYGVRDAGTYNNMAFFLVLPSNPSICRIVKDIDVPPCLTMKDVPKGGWKELPLHACDSITKK